MTQDTSKGPDDKALLTRLLKENLRAQRGRYGLAIAAMVVVGLMTAATAWLMEGIVDAMTDPDKRNGAMWVAALVATVFTVKGFATYVQTVALKRAGNAIVAASQERVYDRLLKQGLGFFSQGSSADLLVRITTGAQAARMAIDAVVLAAARDMVTLLGLVAVMVYQQPFLSIVALVVGPLAILGVRLLIRRINDIIEREMASLAEITEAVQETSLGVQVIKLFGLEPWMRSRVNTAVREVEGRANALAKLEAITSPLMETLSGFAIAGIVALSTLAAFGSDAGSAGQLMSFVTALLMAYEPAKRLSRVRVNVSGQLARVRLMYQVIDAPLALQDAPNAQTLADGPAEITFDNVAFDYGDDTPVLHDISLTCPAGKTTALVGPSGSGKSTILSLTMRMYDPTSGSVQIDGQDIATVTQDSLRARMALVGQEAFLFSTTVRENIRLGRPDATDAEVEEAARTAHAHDFVMELAQGYDTPIGENGASLSGGQRQRLAIARAVLRKADILLLDEATSALDATSETHVRDALGKLSQGVTTIVVAHRLSTIMSADQICVIDGGKVVESGDAKSLLKKPGGLFRTLHDTQFQNITGE